MAHFFDSHHKITGSWKLWIDLALLTGALLFFVFVLWKWVVYASPQGQAYWQVVARLPAPIRKMGESVIAEIRDFRYLPERLFGTSELPLYRLEIKPDRWEDLLSQVPLPGAVLDEIPDWQYVPAKIAYQGREYKIDVRLRGDTPRHWLFPKKSWRVRLDEKGTIEGMKSFNWIVPEDRLFFGEESNYWRARRLGLLTPTSRFVRVSINGGTPMLYWEAEQMNDDFVVHSKLPKGTEIYGDRFLFRPLFTDPNYWQKLASNPDVNPLDFTALQKVLTTLNAASDDTFNATIFSLVDADSFYAWSIHQLLANSTAQGSQHNTRLYFDPLSKKMKFAVWDVGMGDLKNYLRVFEETENPLVARILSNPTFMAERNKRLLQYVQSQENLAAELANYDEWYRRTQVASYQDRDKEFTNQFFDSEQSRLRQILSDQFHSLRQRFTHPAISCHLDRSNKKARVEVRTLLPLLFAGFAAEGQSPPKQGNQVVLEPTIYQERVPTDFFLKSGGHDFSFYYAFYNSTTTAFFSIPDALPLPVSVTLINQATHQPMVVECPGA